MKALENKIDFAVILSVKNANPNGDPLNGNRPRENYAGYGEISDVCIKRKLRNRLLDMGEKVFVQSEDNCNDGFKSLRDRADSVAGLKKAEKDKDSAKFAEIACEEWIDVRAFGQVFAYGNLSVGVRGPVSLHPAFSVSPVNVESIQITKSVNNETKEKKSSDTMGLKHRVSFGVYKFCGAVNCQLAEKTSFTDNDADKLKQALLTMFENDASSARPDGSMQVVRLYWWKHNCKNGQYSSAKVHGSLSIVPKEGVSEPSSADDYDISVTPLDGLTPEIIDGR